MIFYIFTFIVVISNSNRKKYHFIIIVTATDTTVDYLVSKELLQTDRNLFFNYYFKDIQSELYSRINWLTITVTV